LFAALASVLQLAEALLPLPLPGIKFGFANVITLLALTTMGFSASLQVAILRSLISSFILGTFLSPGFLLSFSGAVFSALIMGLAYAINKRAPLFSLIGISILGALAHNFAQMAVISALFIGTKGAMWLVPWLLLSSLVTGYLTGFVCQRVSARLKRAKLRASFSRINLFPSQKDGASIYSMEEIRSLQTSGALKILSFFAVLILSFIIKNIFFYIGCLVVVFVLTMMTSISWRKVLKNIRRVSGLLIFSFVINLAFTAGSRMAGLEAGILAGSRLLLIMMSALLLVQAASPRELVEGLRRIFNSDRIAERTGVAWEALPVLTQYVHKRFRAQVLRKRKNRRWQHIIAFATTTLIIILRQIHWREGAVRYATVRE
jgi:heptaprenyl diphosphate synthase